MIKVIVKEICDNKKSKNDIFSFNNENELNTFIENFKLPENLELSNPYFDQKLFKEKFDYVKLNTVRVIYFDEYKYIYCIYIFPFIDKLQLYEINLGKK